MSDTADRASLCACGRRVVGAYRQARLTVLTDSQCHLPFSRRQASRIAMRSAVPRDCYRVLRELHGRILGWLYKGDEWVCECGIKRGGWVETCGCPRREKRRS